MIGSTFCKPSVQPGAVWLGHDVLHYTGVHLASFILKVAALPSAVHHTVFAITPWALFAGELTTRKLLISGVKGAVHGHSQKTLFNLREEVTCMVTALCVNISYSMEFSP
jgi:hypothetical protein